MSTNVKDAMSKEFVTIKKTEKITEAKKLMLTAESRALFVLDKKKVEGIITEGDFLKEADDSKPCSCIMTTPIISVNQENNLQEAAKLITNNRIGRLPVLNETGEMIGVVTERDIVKDLVVDTKQPKLSPERAAIYLAMTNEREKEEYWLEKSQEEGYKAVITQVGTTAEKLPIKMREATTVAAIARGVIKEDTREKVALSNAVRDAYIQLSSINPGLGGGFKISVVRGEGRITVAAFGKCGHALANGPNNLVMGFSII
ncbi:MAG TPA: HutP family protein [Candidatus Wallbacteria bacterium]|nr:HutP family protein [Candidatus Wallbacteria bacterium]